MTAARSGPGTSRRPGAAREANPAWPTAADGFTLLEIIVALVVLGFLVAGLSQATHFGVASWHTEQRLTDHAAVLERTERVLRQAIMLARPGMSSDDRPFSGEPHRALFLTLLPDQPKAGPRRAQVGIGVDDQHRLILRWQLHPNAIALQPLPPPTEVVLAEGLDHIDFSYRAAMTDKVPVGAWQTEWTASDLPALVSIHFVPMAGGKPWPDLVAATMVDSNGSF